MSFKRALTEADQYLKSWFENQRLRHHIPGLQCTIRIGEHFYKTYACGFANRELEQPLTNQHFFPFASHTKTFVAALVLILAERGVLRLNASVSSFIHELKGLKRWKKCTLLDLLSHRSGFVRDSIKNCYWGLPHCFSDEKQILEECRKEPFFKFKKKSLKYSNIGYGLIGIILSRVTRKPFAALIEKEIFTPLGMKKSALGITQKNRKHLVHVYGQSFEGKPPPALIFSDVKAIAPAGGIITTTEEMSQGMAKLLNPKRTILSAKSYKLLTKKFSTTNKQRAEFYGLGTDILKIANLKVLGHSGGFPGTYSVTYHFFEEDITISLAINSLSGPTMTFMNSTVRTLLFFKKNFRSVSNKKQKQLNRFCSCYKNVWGGQNIFRVGNKLYISDRNSANLLEDAIECTYIDSHTLQQKEDSPFGNPGEPLKFTFKKNGEVASMSDSGHYSVPTKDYERLLSRWQR